MLSGRTPAEAGRETARTRSGSRKPAEPVRYALTPSLPVRRPPWYLEDARCVYCRAAAFLNCRIDSGTKIARISPIHSSEYTTGCASGHTVGFGMSPVFPNASRTASATDETGFHSANTRRGPGSRSARTKVYATKVIGKMNRNDAFWTTSTARTFRPTHAMIHETA